MFSRSYPTGKTTTFVASAQLTLYFCGGVYTSGPPDTTDFPSSPFDAAWIGANFSHSAALQGGLATIPPGGSHVAVGGHSVMFAAFGQDVQLLTERIDLSSDPGFVGAIPQGNLVTRVLLNGTPIETWNSGPYTTIPTVPATISQPPETLVCTVTISVAAAEWAAETDSAILDPVLASSGVRPAYAVDSRLSVFWVPTGLASVVVSGAASGTGTGTPPAVLQTPADFEVAIHADSTEHEPPDSTPYRTAFGTAGKGAIAYPGPTARANNISLSGVVDTWAISHTATDGTGYSRTASRLLTFDFAQNVADSHSAFALLGEERLEVAIDGQVRDWNGLLTNVPIRFDGGGTYLFSRSIAIDDQPVPEVHPPAGYSPTDTGSAVLRYGPAWDGIRLSRASSVPVETFATVGGAHGWSGTAIASGPTVSGDELVATGGSGSPHITKALKSDFEDLAADPAGWWSANHAALPVDAQAWWLATGDPSLTGTAHVGDWWKVGKRLLSGSDVFNWSAFRYMELSGHADSDGTVVTLTVAYTERWYEESSAWNVDPHDTARTVAYAVPLGTSRAAHRIDLAGAAGHHGLRYIQSLRLDFPTGRTVHLHALTLVQNAPPVVDVHQPTADMAVLSAMEDGKHCLFLSTRSIVLPSSVWGWPCQRRMAITLGGSPSTRYQSLTLDELVTELNLQEGWSAALRSAPAHGTPNVACFLEERFALAVPAVLTARRCYGAVAVYPHYRRYADPFPLEANLGNAIEVLAFDPDTRVPVRVPIEADDTGGTTLDTSLTDEHGAGQLEITLEADISVWAGKGSGTATDLGITSQNRTMAFPELTAAEAAAGAGPVSLDVDRLGRPWVAYVPTAGPNAGYVTLARKLVTATAWEYFRVAVGSEPWIKVSEILPEAPICIVFREGTDTIRLATNTRNGTGGAWKMRTIGVGSNPTLLVDKSSGRMLIAYYREGSVYMRRTDDGGATFKEAEYAILTGIADPAPTPMDFDADHHVLIALSDGTNILTMVSVDNALTFS